MCNNDAIFSPKSSLKEIKIIFRKKLISRKHFFIADTNIIKRLEIFYKLIHYPDEIYKIEKK